MHRSDFYGVLVCVPAEDDAPVTDTQPVLVSGTVQLHDVPARRVGEKFLEPLQDTVSHVGRKPLQLFLCLPRENDSPW